MYEKEEVGHLTKDKCREAVLWMKYVFPKLCTQKYNHENKMRQQNPFWPLRMPDDLVESIKEWSEKDCSPNSSEGEIEAHRKEEHN